MTGPSTMVLLPGALQVPATLSPLAAALAPLGEVIALDLPGHGGRVIPETLSPQGIADAILADLNARQVTRAHLVGYSLGGYVALLLAHAHPQRVASVTVHATKLAWTPDVAAREQRGLNPERVLEKVPEFAARLQQMHAPQSWPDLMRRVADMLGRLGEQPLVTDSLLRDLQMPVLLTVGDQDQLVTTEETTAAARAVPHGRCVILPGVGHPLTGAVQEQLATELTAFLNGVDDSPR